eukprot:g6061.t1
MVINAPPPGSSGFCFGKSAKVASLKQKKTKSKFRPNSFGADALAAARSEKALLNPQYQGPAVTPFSAAFHAPVPYVARTRQLQTMTNRVVACNPTPPMVEYSPTPRNSMALSPTSTRNSLSTNDLSLSPRLQPQSQRTIRRIEAVAPIITLQNDNVPMPPSPPSPTTTVGYSDFSPEEEAAKKAVRDAKSSNAAKANTSKTTKPTHATTRYGCTVQGCTFTGSFSDVERHEASEHALFSCARLCGFIGEWEVVERHELTCGSCRA